MKRTSPLLLDPTRTSGIVRHWFADINRRFAKLSRAIAALVVQEDVFGIAAAQKTKTPAFGEVVRNTRYQFLTDQGKLKAFQDWFKEQVDADLLNVDSTGDPWLAKYTTSAYRQGVVRAFLDARKEDLAKSSDFFEGTKAEFLANFFAGQTATSKIKLAATRAFEDMKGITGPMASAMNKVLADGLANGRGAREIARGLVKEAEIGRKRALRIARTETVHAHAEGQLDSLEQLGVEEVGVMVEWSTAGDNRVCQKCKGMAGSIRTIKEARGLIPLHPNCRCAWIPAGVGRKSRSSR